MFLLRKARLVFLDVIFSNLIFFKNVIQRSDCYWVFVQVSTAPMLSKSEILNRKQDSHCQVASTELFSKETKNRVTATKWQKHIWVWCLRVMVLSLCNLADPHFLAWWSLTAQRKGLFQDTQELKRNSMVTIFQERLSTLSIRCINTLRASVQYIRTSISA